MRIGRVGFALGQGAVFAGIYEQNIFHAHISHGTPPELATISIVLFVLAGSWALAILRCHDFNETVWNNFWKEQTPFIGQIWALGELLFKPGTPGRNSYGAAPFI